LAEAAERQDWLNDEVVQGLADIAFGYAEARQHILASLHPLFSVMIDRLLPETAAAALVPHIVAQLDACAAADSTGPVEILASPDNVARLAPALAAATTVPWQLTEDPTLGPVELRWKTPQVESGLDLEGVLIGIRGALAAVTESNQRKNGHG
jgi:flagellar assembly protein FliH